MTLREQILDLATRWANPDWARVMYEQHFYNLIESLAALAFYRGLSCNDESADAQIIKRALDLVARPDSPWIPDDEPGWTGTGLKDCCGSSGE